MSRADSEATAWLDKMIGPDADQHRAAFDEWLAKPGNAKAYDEARDNWTWAGDMSTARIASDVRADAREREPGGRRWAFATILAAVIAVGDRESLGATAGRGGGHVWATIDVGLPPAMIGRVASDG